MHSSERIAAWGKPLLTDPSTGPDPRKRWVTQRFTLYLP